LNSSLETGPFPCNLSENKDVFAKKKKIQVFFIEEREEITVAGIIAFFLKVQGY
jgi:hypothetical protein